MFAMIAVMAIRGLLAQSITMDEMTGAFAQMFELSLDQITLQSAVRHGLVERPVPRAVPPVPKRLRQAITSMLERHK